MKGEDTSLSGELLRVKSLFWGPEYWESKINSVFTGYCSRRVTLTFEIELSLRTADDSRGDLIASPSSPQGMNEKRFLIESLCCGVFSRRVPGGRAMN